MRVDPRTALAQHPGYREPPPDRPVGGKAVDAIFGSRELRET
jgi:hypothetical protein